MARCCGDTCSCKIITVDDVNGNPLVQITGTGTITDPFVFEVLALAVQDSTNIDLSLVWVSGVGYRLSADFASASELDNLGDVNAPSPTNGQVLGWDSGTGKWTPRAPTTAPTGGVDHGTTLTGDGSGGDPLDVAFDPAGDITDSGAGLTLTDEAKNALVLHYTDGTARAAAVPAPVLGTLSTLDDDPGQIHYWDGSDWQPMLQVSVPDSGWPAFQEGSGPFTGGKAVLWYRTSQVGTDLDGLFEIMDSATLASFAGVLSVHVQPMITDPFADTAWAAVVQNSTSFLQGYAYALDGSGPIANNIVTMTVIAWMYI